MLVTFVSELKRRNVFKVAVAYTVFSWLVAQVAATLEEGLGLPEWFDTVILSILIIGFPIAIIISWAYEVTPEGLKKTEDVDLEVSKTAETGKRLNMLTIGAVVVLILFSLSKSYIGPTQQPTVEEVAETQEAAVEAEPAVDNASIAVLPFVNLSADPEQEYFSDGISEELLNLFAKIPELRVAARTSSFQFKGRNMDIPLIGQQLNVAHVLEGSVRKSKNKIRITAQLIQTDTGYHLWSETYDRELDDIFAIQDEISAAIVAELDSILGVESTLVAPESTASANTEAYEEYLLGEFHENKYTQEGLKKALVHYQRAVELDPEYAMAYAALASTELFLSDAIGAGGDLPLAEQIPIVEGHLRNAYALNPKLGDAHLVDGQMQLILGKYDEALAKLDRALELGGDKSSIYNGYFILALRTGDYKGGFEALKKAIEIDPLNGTDVANYIGELNDRGMQEEATTQARRLISFDQRRGEFAFAEIAREQGNMEEALNRTLNSFKLNPSLNGSFFVGVDLLTANGFPDIGRELLPKEFHWVIEMDIGNYDIALAELEKLLATRPDSSFAIRLLSAKAYMHIRQDDWQSANDAMEAGFDAVGRILGNAGGMNVTTALLLYHTRDRTDDTAGAAEILELVRQEIKKRDEAGYVARGYIASHALYYLTIGEEDKALTMLEHAVALGQGMPDEDDFVFDSVKDSDRLKAIHTKDEANLKFKLKVVMTRLCAEGAEEFWQPTPEQCEQVLSKVSDESI